MKEFKLPDLVRANLLEPRDQVSHGLNLVLPLQNRLLLPCLLLDIRKRQRELDEALDGLHFVHFARFLPSPDGTALMVITEFDGPLEPYVMDFAVAIGDIFTMILEYVDNSVRPKLPVQQHPEEFWAFIRQHNRVKILGLPLPSEVDYPVYSAYPRATVLDIVGRRKDLPAPVREATPEVIDRHDVQGNILEGYKARCGEHLVLRIVDRTKARAWIAALPITPATRWAAKPATALNIGFTYRGLQALGVPRRSLETLPADFTEGPADAARAEANGDFGESAPVHWDLGHPGKADQTHVMLTLYALTADDTTFQAELAAIVAGMPAGGVQLVDRYPVAPREDKREPFGFQDDIGQPRVAEVSEPNGPRPDLQPRASPGLFLLGRYRNVFGHASVGRMDPPLVENGTFCAVRVLRQHVKAYEEMVGAASQASGCPHALIEAKLMGRWKGTGEPLATVPETPSANAPKDPGNAFDYVPSFEYPHTHDDHDGLRCPVGAHMRRANPRSGRVAGVRHTRRLIRRGLPYKTVDASGQVDEGIFGMFICGSLERQFEFVQQQWLNGDVFTSGVRGMRDPIAGANSPGDHFEFPTAKGPVRVTIPRRLVTTSGSLYLFLPGIGMLKSLAGAGGGFLEGMVMEGHDDGNLFDEATIEAAAAQVEHGLYAPDGTAPASWLESGPPLAEADDFDPLSHRFRADPYPFFKTLRKTPVRWVPAHQSYWVTSHALVKEMLAQDGAGGRFTKLPSGSWDVRGVFTMDPERHTHVRALVMAACRGPFSQARSVTARRAAEAITHVKALGPGFDFVEHIGRRIPREVFFELLGLPADEWAEVDDLARTIMMHADRTLNALERKPGLVAGVSLGLKLGWLLAKPLSVSGVPEASILGSLRKSLSLLAGETSLTLPECVMTLVQMLLGGYLSTEFLLNTGTRQLLLGGRVEWEAVLNDRRRLPAAIDEMRRFEAPLTVVDRYAATDIMFGGVLVRKDSHLQALLGSANHDDTVFPSDPDTFVVGRTNIGDALTLGHGIHECLGKGLQAAVVPEVFEALLSAFPTLRLEDPLMQPPWFRDIYFRSFGALPVRVD